MRKSQALYIILKIKPWKMPDVWKLVKQYPPPDLLNTWYPHVMPEKDVELLYARYHENGEVRATLREIGKEHGLAAERVRVRLRRILEWLHDQLHDQKIGEAEG